MNKKLNLVLAMLLMVMGAMAGPISESEALAIAGKFLNTGSSMHKAPAKGKALKLAAATKGYYAFNCGELDGYVIVAADDNATVDVLGYADKGTFDVNNMPENMKWWLGEYTRQLEYAATHPSENRVRSNVQRAEIAPLLTCNWNQGAPYNKKCPELNGERCVTGCVATAMAQVMYYHKWPEQGTGSNSYLWETGNQTLSADFSQSTYEWDKMVGTYNGNTGPAASLDAVAKLMYDVGISLDMEYNVSSTGGSATPTQFVTQALANNFSYDKSIVYNWRNCYKASEWEDMLYEGLSSYGPVVYHGRGDGGGHAFVCDGYQNGYFHFNWGWGGTSNGYFALSALDPDNQGIGGNSAGYNHNQGAIMNITPDRDGSSSFAPSMYCQDFTTEVTTVTTSDNVKFIEYYSNSGAGEISYMLGIKVVDNNGTEKILFPYSYYTPNPRYIYTAINVPMANFPTQNGKYTVSPVYAEFTGYVPSPSEWIDMPCDRTKCNGKLTATVSGGNITFSKYVDAEEGDITVSSATVNDNKNIYAGKNFTVSAVITAVGGNYYGDVCAALTATNGTSILAINKVLADVAEGGTFDVTFTLTAPETEGNYDVVIIDKDYYILKRIPITVNEVPTGDCKIIVNSLTIENASDVDPENAHFTADITCNSGYYDGYIVLYYYPITGGYPLGFLYDHITIAEGERMNVDFTGALDGCEFGQRYFAQMILNEEDASWLTNSSNQKVRTIFTVTNKMKKEIPESGYASFSSACNMSVPEDVTVYKAKVNGDKVVLTEVETSVIPANTGVILYSETPGIKTFTLTATSSSADFSDNELIATSVEANATVPEEGTYYALKANRAEFAVVAGGVVLSYGKAYIAAPSAGAKTLSIVFDEPETTGISSVNAENITDDAYYTLQGMKVSVPGKGVYIKNGKKVLIK